MSFISLTTDFGGGGGVIARCDLEHLSGSKDRGPDPYHPTARFDQGTPGPSTNKPTIFPRAACTWVVVDPGVGTQRRPIAVQAGDHYFVGPDNGVFSSRI